MELLLDVFFGFIAAIAILGWSTIFACWGLFGYAAFRGWLTEHTTPAEIWQRIKNEQTNY